MKRQGTIRPVLAGLAALSIVAGCGFRGEQVEAGFGTKKAPDVLAMTEHTHADADHDTDDHRQLAADPGADFATVRLSSAQQAEQLFDFEVDQLVDYNTGTTEPLDGYELYRAAPTVVSFMTPACALCIEHGAELADAAVNNPDVNFVAAMSHGTIDHYLEFASTTGLDRGDVIILDQGTTDLWSRFDVLVQPAYVLVDRRGQVATRPATAGTPDLDILAEELRAGLPTG